MDKNLWVTSEAVRNIVALWLVVKVTSSPKIALDMRQSTVAKKICVMLAVQKQDESPHVSLSSSCYILLPFDLCHNTKFPYYHQQYKQCFSDSSGHPGQSFPVTLSKHLLILYQ